MLLMVFLRFNCKYCSIFGVSEWVSGLGWELGGAYLLVLSCVVKGFVTELPKGGDCECLARLIILDKNLKCPLGRFSNSSSDYFTFGD